MQEMTVYGVSFDLVGKQPIVLLRTAEGRTFLPIWIGHPEAAAILMRLQGQDPPRPLTHDLTCSIIDSLDASVERVTVTELRDSTFFAQITLVLNGTEIEIDSRTSDAIAIALRTDAKIFAADHPMTARLQLWVDALDGALRRDATVGPTLGRTPKPEVFVVESSSINAWVNRVGVRWQVGGTLERAPSAEAPAAPGEILHLKRIGKITAAIDETMIVDRPHDAASLAGFAASQLRAESISSRIDSKLTFCSPRPVLAGRRRRMIRQAVTNASALVRLPSSS